MAKFCTRCGKKLEKDEKCTCDKIKQSTENRTFSNETIFDQIAQFLKRPIEHLKNEKFMNGNEYWIILMNAILIAIGFTCCSFIELPARIIFMITILGFVFFLLLALIYSLFYKQEQYHSILRIVSISSIPLLVSNLCGIIFSFASIFLSLICFLFGFVLFLLYCYHGLVELDYKNKDKTAYQFNISLFVTMIIMLLLVNIL